MPAGVGADVHGGPPRVRRNTQILGPLRGRAVRLPMGPLPPCEAVDTSSGSMWELPASGDAGESSRCCTLEALVTSV